MGRTDAVAVAMAAPKAKMVVSFIVMVMSMLIVMSWDGLCWVAGGKEERCRCKAPSTFYSIYRDFRGPLLLILFSHMLCTSMPQDGHIAFFFIVIGGKAVG